MPDELLAGQDTPASSEAQTPAPAQANAGTDASGAETEAQQKETPNEPKTLTLTEDELKDRIERATAKAAAKAERRALREARELLMRTAPVQQPQQQDDGRPSRDQFASDEQFVEALTDWKLDQRERGERQTRQQEQARTMAEKTEKIYAEAEKIPGFDRDDFDALPLTPVIAQALIDSDVAAKLAAYMAQHPDEVARVVALPYARQAAEVGKWEVKLTTTAKPPKTPAPIEPVGSGASPIKSLATMSAEEYFEARMKQRPVWARR